MYFRAFIIACIAIAFIQCNQKKDNIYENIIAPEMKAAGIEDYNGKILALSNSACHKCASGILDLYEQFNCDLVVIYDTTVYGKAVKKDECHHLKGISNDKLARVNLGSINGHRIYWIKDRQIEKVKELNAMNADSIFYFIK